MLPNHLEKITFHSILNNKEYVNIVKPNFFKSPNYSDLYKIASEFVNKFNQTPSKQQMLELVKIRNLTNVTVDFIDTLYDIKLDNYEQDWLEESVEAWIEFNKLDSSVENLLTYLKTTKISTENVKNVVETAKDIIIDGTNIDFKFDEGLDFFNPESHKQPVYDTFATGYPYLDTVLGGGWSTKALYVIAGENKIGKCLNINTLIKIKNKKTGKIIELSIGDFYKMQNK